MVHAHSFGSMTDGNKAESDLIVLIDDEVVKISAILLHPFFSGESAGTTDIQGLNRSDSKPGEVAVIYACELSEIKGKFDPLKAQALGLKPGPKYRELQLGKSVKSDRLDIMVSCNYPEFSTPFMSYSFSLFILSERRTKRL